MSRTSAGPRPPARHDPAPARPPGRSADCRPRRPRRWPWPPAACKGKATPAPTSAAPDAVAKFWAGKTKNGHVDFANWPLYMDPKQPELKKFTEETGITVNYQEVIQEMAPWFAKVQPQLSAGQSIGYDLMVITNGIEFKQFVRARLPRPAGPLEAAELRGERGRRRTRRRRSTRATSTACRGRPASPASRTTRRRSRRRSPSSPTCGTRRTRARSACSPTPRSSANFGLLDARRRPGEVHRGRTGRRRPRSCKQQKDAGIVRKYYDQGYIDALASGEVWITPGVVRRHLPEERLGRHELQVRRSPRRAARSGPTT